MVKRSKSAVYLWERHLNTCGLCGKIGGLHPSCRKGWKYVKRLDKEGELQGIVPVKPLPRFSVSNIQKAFDAALREKQAELMAAYKKAQDETAQQEAEAKAGTEQISTQEVVAESTVQAEIAIPPTAETEGTTNG